MGAGIGVGGTIPSGTREVRGKGQELARLAVTDVVEPLAISPAATLSTYSASPSRSGLTLGAIHRVDTRLFLRACDSAPLIK